MRYYFLPFQNSSFRGIQRMTLPITLNEDIVRISQHLNFSQRYGIQWLQSLQDLDRLFKLGNDRQLWKHLCNRRCLSWLFSWSGSRGAFLVIRDNINGVTSYVCKGISVFKSLADLTYFYLHYLFRAPKPVTVCDFIW